MNNGTNGVRTAHGMDARPDGARRLPDRLAFRVLQLLGQFAAIRHLRAGGMKRLESRFRFSGLRPDAQRVARAMDPPVIRVEIGIEDLQRRAGFDDETVDRAMVGQPAAHGAEIGARELPFDLALVLMTGFLLCCGGA